MEDVKWSNPTLKTALIAFSCGLISSYVFATTLLKLRDKQRRRIALITSTKTIQQSKNTQLETTLIGRDEYIDLITLIGEERFQKIEEKYVIIVGLGGIGSHAANCLVRSGVKHIRLVDFDQVTLSSLNRHAVATRVDVGRPKADVLKEHLMKFSDHVKIEAVRQIFTKENAYDIIMSETVGEEKSDSENEEGMKKRMRKPDFVLDCIDNVPTKVELLYFCKTYNIPVITSAGAGCRMDPTRLRICDLKDTCYDPLLRATRLRLSRYNIKEDIPCVFSNEKPPKKLLPLLEGEQEDDPQLFQALPDIQMRVRIVPVLGPMPAIYGDIMAMEVLRRISELNEVTDTILDKKQKKHYMHMLHKLTQFEKRHHPSEKHKSKVTIWEIEYVVHELFGGKSAFSGSEAFRSKLIVVRWDKTKPPSIDNIVPLSYDEALRHYSQPGFSAWPDDFVVKVSSTLSSIPSDIVMKVLRERSDDKKSAMNGGEDDSSDDNNSKSKSKDVQKRPHNANYVSKRVNNSNNNNNNNNNNQKKGKAARRKQQQQQHEEEEEEKKGSSEEVEIVNVNHSSAESETTNDVVRDNIIGGDQ